MPVTYTITTSTGFPIESPPGSPISGDLVPSNLLPGIYGGVPISFNLKFSSDEAESISNIVANSSLTSIGLNFQIASTTTDTVIISGTLTNIFGETFRFLMRDSTEKLLPVNNSEDWVAIIKWSPPNIYVKEINYTFTYTVNVSESVSYISTTSFAQEVFYGFQQSLTSFKTLVNQGEI